MEFESDALFWNGGKVCIDVETNGFPNEGGSNEIVQIALKKINESQILRINDG